jgi:hypothetical protein
MNRMETRYLLPAWPPPMIQMVRRLNRATGEPRRPSPLTSSGGILFPGEPKGQQSEPPRFTRVVIYALLLAFAAPLLPLDDSPSSRCKRSAGARSSIVMWHKSGDGYARVERVGKKLIITKYEYGETS